MVQVKLTSVFFLTAFVLAPIVALPLPDGGHGSGHPSSDGKINPQ